MVNETRDVYVIELSPGNFWVQTPQQQGSNLIVSIGYASLATPVQKDSPAYKLEGFSRETFPLIRVVRVLVTAREYSSAGLTN